MRPCPAAGKECSPHPKRLSLMPRRLALCLALACTRGPTEVEAGPDPAPDPAPVLAPPRADTRPAASAPVRAAAEEIEPPAARPTAPPGAPRLDPSAKGRVRAAIVARGELLRSEQRALDGIKAALGRRVSLELGDATDDERAFALAHLEEGAAPAPLPAAWSGFEAVIVLEVLAPRGVKPSRFSRGLGGVLVVRPPRAAPVFVERVTGEVGTSLGDDTLVASLGDVLALAEDPA